VGVGINEDQKQKLRDFSIDVILGNQFGDEVLGVLKHFTVCSWPSGLMGSRLMGSTKHRLKITDKNLYRS
jgi:hypothetical protein